MLQLLLTISLALEQPTVVEFYAPWCPVCKRFEPEWRAAESLLSSQVAFSRVDCDSEIETCEDWQITEYPTVVLIDNTMSSSFLTYTGPLSSDSLSSWILQGLVDTTTTTPSRVLNPPGNKNDMLWGINETLSHLKAPVEKGLADYVRAYLDYVAELFPQYAAVSAVVNQKHMLERLYINLQRPISYETWERASKQFPPLSKEGRACTNSACAVWTMMHTLTVSATNKARALEAAAHVVVATLPCKECATEFNKSIWGQNGIQPVSDILCDNGAAWWLFEVHNNVNQRLSKPAFPGLNCTECKTSESLTVKFLEKTYKFEKPLAKTSHSVVVATCVLMGPFTLALAHLFRSLCE